MPTYSTDLSDNGTQITISAPLTAHLIKAGTVIESLDSETIHLTDTADTTTLVVAGTVLSSMQDWAIGYAGGIDGAKLVVSATGEVHGGVYSNSAIFVQNNGLLFDDDGALVTSDAADVIVNRGEISSALHAVRCEDGSDVIINTGRITGEVMLGSGDDGYDNLEGTTAGRILGGAGKDTMLGGRGMDLLSGEADADLLEGNDGRDFLDGGSGADILDGGERGDFLSGGTGLDRLTGGTGLDSFRFASALTASNYDRVQDFSHADDTISLANSVFAGLGPTVTAGELKIGTTPSNSVAADASDRLIYNKTTGYLYYDSDGSGANAKVAFAILTGSPDNLAADDFVIV